MRFELAGVLASGFLSIYFLHAGLDRLLNRRGNLTRFSLAFDHTPMRRPMGAWLTLLTLTELVAGVVSAAGCLSLLVLGQPMMALSGAAVGGLSLLLLFAGLRLGCDYTGAAQTVPYFVTCLAALVLLGGR
jgi:hypothetical protein